MTLDEFVSVAPEAIGLWRSTERKQRIPGAGSRPTSFRHTLAAILQLPRSHFKTPSNARRRCCTARRHFSIFLVLLVSRSLLQQRRGAPTPRLCVHIVEYAPLSYQAAPCPQPRSEVLKPLLIKRNKSPSNFTRRSTPDT